jgi:hypothetical protein
MAKRQPFEKVSIGKFDILATSTYAQALLDGQSDDEAKQRGMVAGIMGAQARLGARRDHHEEFRGQKLAAERKKEPTITGESFDKQVADKMGEFFEDVFLPVMKKLIEAGLSYDEVKRLVKIPTTWGAKISAEQFRERASKGLNGRPTGSLTRPGRHRPTGARRTSAGRSTGNRTGPSERR